MHSVTDSIETIQHDIQLHEKLHDLVIEERNYRERNMQDCADETADRRKKIQDEIEQLNTSIVSMFPLTDNVFIEISEENRIHLAELLNKLRKSILNTTIIIEETMKSVKKEKDKTARQLQTLKKSKKAINSYLKYEII